MIPRHLKAHIEKRMFKGRAIIVLGPRQSGKTTLITDLLKKYPDQTYSFNGDEPDIRDLFHNATSTKLKSIIGNKSIVFIDEAQRIPEIGLCIKLLVDNYPRIQVIATGSSSLELSDSIREPLTGRKYELYLFPLAYQEMLNHIGRVQEDRLLSHRLIFGSYPEVVSSPGEEIELVRLLADSYLFKDLFNLEQIKKPPLLEKIIRTLALQVGSEVSYNEIAQLVSADRQTVEKYIGLMEKAYIVHRLPALKRNVRNEIKHGRKIYFWDNGILNAMIGNFNPISSRTDTGALWENFVISERRKYLSNNQIYARPYFWRTTQQQEIDYIEELNAEFAAYEIKWNPSKKAFFSKSFVENYPISSTATINPDNLGDWIGN
ncbi:MAG: ATP-binding protein [Candidatus Cloacimonetes bacterium]|nr:ATP-binding protein [Candidatus Cloacimonadota bacterium]MDD3532714.1 ATP-binding protein [Candidatus Cloacimonadota bacterium]